MEHPKDKGDRALGYSIYTPFGDNTRCDLIVETEGRIARVQCKSGRLRNGAVEFAVCSTYGHHKNPRARARDYHGEVDYFAVYCVETSGVYLVPIGELPGTRAAFLRVEPSRNGQRRLIRFAARYEIGRVATAGPRGPSGG